MAPDPDPATSGPGSGSSAEALEQRTLSISLAGVALIAAGSLVWGLAIESDVVIVNGVFSLVSLVGSILYLTAARLVARPADRRFQYGYAHVEPLVNSVNALLVTVICVYAFINGLEGVRAGGDVVDAEGVIWFGAVTAIVCGAMGGYELAVSRRIESGLLRNDAREWLMDAAFSSVTLAGFAVLYVLEEPHRSLWARHADSVLVMVLSALFLPVPLGVIRHNLREVLHMAAEDDPLTMRVASVMQAIRAEHDILRHSTHVAKVGREYFVDVDFVVGPGFAPQTVAAQDALRARIRTAVDDPPGSTWLNVNFTAADGRT